MLTNAARNEAAQHPKTATSRGTAKSPVHHAQSRMATLEKLARRVVVGRSALLLPAICGARALGMSAHQLRRQVRVVRHEGVKDFRVLGPGIHAAHGDQWLVQPPDAQVECFYVLGEQAHA